MSEGLNVVRPLSSKPLYMRMRESLVYWIYALKRLYIIYYIFCPQRIDFAVFSKYRAV